MLFFKAKAAWSTLPIRYIGGALLAVPAICLTTAMGVWIVSQRVNSSIYQEIEGGRERLFQLKDLLTHLLSAETAVRGFSLTRDPQYLEPYQTATRQISTILKHLELEFIHTADLPKIYKIQQLSEDRLKILEIRIKSLGVNRPNLNLTPEDRKYISEGKQVVARLRLLVNELETAESEKLIEHRKRIARNKEIGDLIIWLTSGITLIIYLKLIYLFSKVDWELAGQKLELLESNSLLQTLMDNVVDGVISLNEAGEIEGFNHAAAEMFGYPGEEAIGQKIDNFILPSDRENSETLLNSSNAPFLAIGNRQIGSNFPIEISVSKLPFDKRKMLIFRDITQRREAEKKLESHIKELSRLSIMLSKTNQALTERNQELDQFAYVASHDLKAPLRAIFSLSEWIEEDLGDKLPEETQHQMQLLRQRVGRMEALINGLLEYCRVGRTQAQIETINVGTLIKEVVDSLGIPNTFDIEIDPNLPTMPVKSLLLKQVLANLIDNAVKHQNKLSGNIKIYCQELERFYEFSVADDGIGIGPQYQAQIFRIFQTLEARDIKDSTGIGLAIVKKIVESEGGKIRVESDAGKGATFSFTWRKQPKD